jgi:uncharacterized protein YceK
MNKHLILVAACLLLASCAFSYERIDQDNYGEVFASTRRDIDVLSKDNFILGNFKFIFIFDIPFSLITDIIILPYDVYIIVVDDKSDSDSGTSAQDEHG